MSFAGSSPRSLVGEGNVGATVWLLQEADAWFPHAIALLMFKTLPAPHARAKTSF